MRSARADDADAMQRIVNGAAFVLANQRGPFLNAGEFASMIEKLPPTDRLLLAEIDGAVSGFVLITCRSGRLKHVAELGLGVADHLAGQGIGSALIETAIDVADNWFDLRRLELFVDVDNLRAISLYERFGFIREGVLHGRVFRDGADRDSLIMARRRQDVAGRD